jgi:hypothetical protein
MEKENMKGELAGSGSSRREGDEAGEATVHVEEDLAHRSGRRLWGIDKGERMVVARRGS